MVPRPWTIALWQAGLKIHIKIGPETQRASEYRAVIQVLSSGESVMISTVRMPPHPVRPSPSSAYHNFIRFTDTAVMLTE